MLKKLTIGAAIALVAGVLPSPAMAVPGANSMTSCVLTDGTTTTSNYALNVSDGVAPRTDTVTMVPTPSTGKTLFSENGFVNKTTGEFVQMGSGTGAVDNAGYQPPADPGYYIATQRFPNYPDYPSSAWTYEFRWWAVTSGGLPDMPGSPLCKIAVAVAPADSTAPTISGSDAVSLIEPDTAVGTYTADETVTWSITGGADQSLLTIDPNTGELKFSSASKVGTYVVTITATDTAGNTTPLTITVTVGLTSLASTGSNGPALALALGLPGLMMLVAGFVMVRRAKHN